MEPKKPINDSNRTLLKNSYHIYMWYLSVLGVGEGDRPPSRRVMEGRDGLEALPGGVGGGGPGGKEGRRR